MANTNPELFNHNGFNSHPIERKQQQAHIVIFFHKKIVYYYHSKAQQIDDDRSKFSSEKVQTSSGFHFEKVNSVSVPKVNKPSNGWWICSTTAFVLSVDGDNKHHICLNIWWWPREKQFTTPKRKTKHYQTHFIDNQHRALT